MILDAFHSNCFLHVLASLVYLFIQNSPCEREIFPFELLCFHFFQARRVTLALYVKSINKVTLPKLEPENNDSCQLAPVPFSVYRAVS